MLPLAAKLFVLSSVPLAVAFSYDPGRQSNGTQESWVARVLATEPGTSPGEPHSATRAEGLQRAEMSQDQVRSMLTARGVPMAKAALAAETAACAGGLSATSHVWIGGQRLTGALLVPDSAQVICGYGHLPQWAFRSAMQANPENLDCASRILKKPRGNRWVDSLARAGACNQTLAQSDGSSETKL